MKASIIAATFIAILGSRLLAWDVRTIPLGDHEVGQIGRLGEQYEAECVLDYFYLLTGCAYVTVIDGIAENQSVGLHFNMGDSVAWYPPCDTAACLTLDMVDLVFYDVLELPADQSMNVQVYGADTSGEPVGQPLGNCNFSPLYTDTASFTTTGVDFTNGGAELGLDLSGCGGDFVVILTWKNPTGHPALVLDNISTCVDSCPVNAVCCQMGSGYYVYPRLTTHTYDFGFEGAWSRQDSFPDPGGAGTYGYLEALWTCRFCRTSSATRPASWGAIKALYR